jgi:hypothetical protein
MANMGTACPPFEVRRLGLWTGPQALVEYSDSNSGAIRLLGGSSEARNAVCKDGDPLSSNIFTRSNLLCPVIFTSSQFASPSISTPKIKLNLSAK